jgi:hypothetical protein
VWWLLLLSWSTQFSNYDCVTWRFNKNWIPHLKCFWKFQYGRMLVSPSLPTSVSFGCLPTYFTSSLFSTHDCVDMMRKILFHSVFHFWISNGYNPYYISNLTNKPKLPELESVLKIGAVICAHVSWRHPIAVVLSPELRVKGVLWLAVIYILVPWCNFGSSCTVVMNIGM